MQMALRGGLACLICFPASPSGVSAGDIAADQPGARATLLAAVASRAPSLTEAPAPQYVDDGTRLFCGNQPFGIVFAFITAAEARLGSRFRLIRGLGSILCADTPMQPSS